MKIFLAGKIQKGKEEKDKRDFTESIIPHIRLKNAEFIKGEKRDLDESDFFLVFGWDCRHAGNADSKILR